MCSECKQKPTVANRKMWEPHRSQNVKCDCEGPVNWHQWNWIFVKAELSTYCLGWFPKRIFQCRQHQNHYRRRLEANTRGLTPPGVVQYCPDHRKTRATRVWFVEMRGLRIRTVLGLSHVHWCMYSHSSLNGIAFLHFPVQAWCNFFERKDSENLQWVDFLDETREDPVDERLKSEKTVLSVRVLRKETNTAEAEGVVLLACNEICFNCFPTNAKKEEGWSA